MQYWYLMLSSVEILILAAIQGISEFLPISSVAHLVLVSKYYEFANQNLLNPIEGLINILHLYVNLLNLYNLYLQFGKFKSWV